MENVLLAVFFFLLSWKENTDVRVDRYTNFNIFLDPSEKILIFMSSEVYGGRAYSKKEILPGIAYKVYG